jgi:hypothetical protein
MADERDHLERGAGETPAPQSADNPHTSFEPSDANIRRIFVVGLVLGVFCVMSMIGMIWLFDVFANRMGGAPGPAAELPARDMRFSREPRLAGLPSPTEEQQTAIDASRGAFGWVDRDRQIVRIPVHDAMRIVASQLRASSPAPDTGTPEDKHVTAERTQPPGPSSSGRIVEGHGK